jgi:hypothetical protein
MKRVLLFVVLVIIFGLTSFSLEAGPVQPEAEKPTFTFASGPAGLSSCTVGSQAGLPHSILNSQPQSLDYCGVCSDSQCQGAQRWQTCWLPGIQGGWGWCDVRTWAQFCAEDNQWECICRSTPIE